MEGPLRTRVKTGVSSIAATVEWDERPQRSSYPAVVLETVDAQRTQNMDGFDTFRPTLMQFNCFATNKTTAINLREAVIAAITPEATVGGTRFLRAQGVEHRPRNENTDTGFVHCEIVEATIWHD